MENIFFNILFFLSKSIIVVFSMLLFFTGIIVISIKTKKQTKDSLIIENLSIKNDKRKLKLASYSLSKQKYKLLLKQQAKQDKQNKKNSKKAKSCLFVLEFIGDIQAKNANDLIMQIDTVLTMATVKDEVLVKIESGGGMIANYGLIASQLQRIKDMKIPLTVAIDKIAASGGYLVACVADKILAAPFAIIGSVGVIAQIPNFYNFLKKHDIDVEQITAGKHKRTLTIFGENTPEKREKLKQELEEIHNIFSNFIQQNRSKVKIEKINTGEWWLATDAIKLQLVDILQTSNDYISKKYNTNTVLSIKNKNKKSCKFLRKILSKNTLLDFLY